MKTKNIILGSTAALLLTCAAVADTTVFWGGSPLGTHLNSAGVSLTAPQFTFQLGAFDSGFDPAVAPFQMWQTNWNVFDTAAYNNVTMFFDATAEMSSTTGLSNGVGADPTFDFRGTKLYMWIYDDNTVDMAASSTICYEWALLSAVDWTLPTTTPPGGVKPFPLEFRLGNAGEAWIGAVDPAALPPIEGSLGTYTTPASYDVRTNEFCVVPEPSSLLIGLFGFTSLLVRRKRNS